MTVQRFPLSPVDYVFTGKGSQPITFAYFFRNQLDPHSLIGSLKQALHLFPILKSQLKKVSEKDYEYLISEQDFSMEVVDSRLPFQESAKATDYIDTVSTSADKFLMNIRLTQTQQGSVLAVSISHALVDGFSYFHFLLSWAALCRGKAIIKPHLDREVILANLRASTQAVTREVIYSECGLFLWDKSRNSLCKQPDIERIFISLEEIESHRRKFKSDRDISLSKNDVISALLWKKLFPIWNQKDGDLQTHITLPFDFRRILPGMPPNYFGCALCFATASTNLDGLSRASVGDLALLIRNSVSRIKSDFVCNYLNRLESLRCHNGLAAMEKIHLRHPETGLIVTNLTRMPLRDIDFGSGSPESFLAYADLTSSAAILPANEGVEVFMYNPL